MALRFFLDIFGIFLEVLVENLDLGGLAQLVHGFLHLLAQQNIADRRLHLVKGLRRAQSCGLQS